MNRAIHSRHRAGSTSFWLCLCLGSAILAASARAELVVIMHPDGAEVLDLVSQNPGVVGYVERSVVDARVAVVYALSP